MRGTRAVRSAFGIALLLAGSPAAAQEDRGSGSLDSIDPAFGVVTIGGAQYSVRSSTVIADEHGNARSLEELPSLATGASADEAAVWYEAGEATSGAPRPLLRLQLSGGLPQ